MDAEQPPLVAFADLMRHLRTACAWKAEQTHASLTRHLLEETYETLEAIELGEATGEWAHLREELGDLLLQVYFHAVVAEEKGEFTLDEVVQGIHDKMVRRNPHVFGPQAGQALTPDQINDLWQEAKAREKADVGEAAPTVPSGPELAAGLPPGLPALLWADKVADRAERAGQPLTVDPDDAGDSAPLGDRLLALVLEARAAGIDPEQALRDAVRTRL
ncbi:MazG nucleotide pyrophosphohydrolase domain-containing protein [Nocardioides jishulii]|nr:MazG nucleotide pyrophosphohydrolase domain-containing protein [Nocardioides jishulii]